MLALVLMAIYQGFHEGVGIYETVGFRKLKAIAICLLFAIASFYFHEGGHYGMRKLLFPKEKISVIYSRQLIVPYPVAVAVPATLPSRGRGRKVAVMLAGPLMGLIPIGALYFFDQVSFLILLACSLLIGNLADYLEVWKLIFLPEAKEEKAM
jgi:hypothetical protein